jgi:CheY-like chemotaxis protein
MNPALSLPSILVVERDDELRDVLTTLLTEEGYKVHPISSLAEALRLLDEQVFHLVLADLFFGRSPHAFREAHILRRRAHPIPVGLLTTQNLAPEEATCQGFAFLLREPFEINDLLARVATAINQPLSPDQQALAEIVWRFFTALQDADWQTLATLCTENLAYYPPTNALSARSRKIHGLRTYLSYAEATRHEMPDSRFSMITLFARPKGLAARYQVSWVAVDGIVRRVVGTSLFHFQGARISQIGNRLNGEHLRSLTGKKHAG